MVVLALVLLLIVAMVVTGVLFSTSAEHDLQVLNLLVRVSDTGMFLAGAIAALLAVLAVILLRTGIERSRARRRRPKALNASTTTFAAPPAAPTPATTPAPPAVTSPSGPTPDRSVGSMGAEPNDPAPASSLDLNEPEPTTAAAERQRLLAEADAVTRDDPPR